MNIKIKKTWLIAEFLLLFFGLPLALYFSNRIKQIHPVLLLLPVFLFFLLYFRQKKDFSFKSFLRFDISSKTILKNAGLILLASIALLAYVYLFERENMFNLPRKNTRLYIVMMVVYPLISAFIQEVIYRVFIFRRYSRVFTNKTLMIFASAVAFSFVHIVYFSPFAIAATFLAGIYFAYIYEKTKSVLFTTVLHGFIGNVVFTVGLGHHFWQNMQQYL